MIFEQAEPTEFLSDIVKSFWMVDSEDDCSVRTEKIVPDGYPEMIFHYKSPYRINIRNQWQLQTPNLIAGQLTNYFFLESTGCSGMFAIKFQPWALNKLFGIDMSKITDRVISIEGGLLTVLAPLRDLLVNEISFEERVKNAEIWITKFIEANKLKNSYSEKSILQIMKRHAAISVDDLVIQSGLNRRTLERYFQKEIGISPKFYCRIIRFSKIFRHVCREKPNWSDISFAAGYYDQSHFIRNFKEFTGEEPSKYGFNEQSLANFFLPTAD
ncbi:AraC family transcriptional regulator [Crocinitomix catalasitica]|nr:AraC family transcriptional regulator [Crocinitomix catalasitica]